MSLSAYFIVVDARTASLRKMLDKAALTYCTIAFSFEKGFKDTSPLKRDMLMMWMADVDGTAILFCVCVPAQ